MRGCISSILMVCVMVITGFVGFIIFESNIVSAQTTIYVDDDNTMGPWDGSLANPWETITDGVIATTDGDTVFVFNGTYNEYVIIDKTINLTGENRDNTTINGGGFGPVVLVTANWANITGFRITNGSIGIEVWTNVNNVTIENNNISANDIGANSKGIYLNQSTSKITIIYNEIHSNNDTGPYRGIHLDQGSANNTIKNNNISLNRWEGGISLSYSSDNDIINNNITNQKGEGIYASYSSYNDIIGNNASSIYGRGIYLSLSDNNSIIGNNAEGIWLWHSPDNDVLDNNVTNGPEGIRLDNSLNNDIIGNNVTSNNFYGMFINDFSDHNTIKNNDISDNDNGIHVKMSSNNDILGNNVTDPKEGIWLDQSSDNTVIGNNVSSNGFNGILLTSSSSNDIIGNNVTDNGYTGINLTSSSDNNLILNNNVSLNDEHGIGIFSSSLNDIIGNNVSSNIENGIYLESALNNNVTSNEVFNNFDGIHLYSSSENNTVRYNNVSFNNDDGINLFSRANNNTIKGNNVSHNSDDGIFLRSSSDNNITNNNVWNNSDGFYIYFSSHNNTVHHNNIFSNNNDGMQVDSSMFNDITYNDIRTNNNRGINFGWSSDFNTITNNNITDNVDGIYLSSADGNILSDNNISYNDDYGVYLSNSRGNILFDNTMIENGIFIFGNTLNQWDSHSIDTSNMVNGKPLIYWKNQTGGVVPPGAGQVIIVNCTNVVVVSQEVNNCSVGIEMGYSTDSFIVFNNGSNNIYGFYIYNSNLNTISNNNVSFNRLRGIYIGFSDGNDILNNIVYNNNLGIFVRIATNNNVTGNNVSDNLYGIYLVFSDGNNITYNNISLNSEYGINIDSSDGNTLVGNNVSNNENGIYLTSSLNNLIYHNNIINNTNQSFDDTNDGNQWDNGYPSGGNYWSNFSPICPDLYNGSVTPQTTGSADGICDNQYDIDADSTDYYPLKGPWDPSSTSPSAPLVLTANAGVTYVDISWNPPASDGGFPVTGYRIYRGMVSNGEIFLTEIGNFTQFNDTNVTGGFTYYYKVSAINILGEGPLSNEASGIPISVPNAPTGLGTLSGDSYVNLSWTAPSLDGGSAIIMYKIYRNGTFSVYNTTSARQLWFNDTNVTNGITYTYNVSAVNGIGEGPKSADTSATPMTVPSAPENLQVNVGDGYVGLYWNAPQDDGGSPISGYNIYRNGTPGVYDTFGTAQAWYVDSNVTNGITYTYNITAVNSMGEGPSSTISATPMTVPSAPENPQASAGNGIVHVTWDAPLDNGGSAITGYNIYRSDVAGVYATVPAGQLSYDDTNVVNGVTYTYNISANNSVGEGPKSMDASDTPMTVPTAPQNLQAEAGNGYVNLTWEVPSGDGGSAITGYNIYRNDTAGVYSSVPSGQLWFNDTSVTNGITYSYNVSAINIVGEGARSAISANPMTIPTAPENLQIAIGNGYLNLTWDIPTDNGGSAITGYNIYRNDTTGVYDSAPADQPWFSDYDVVTGITYMYYVSAINDAGEGQLSAGETATAGSVPSAPTGLAADAGDSYVYLTWNIPVSNGSYPITNYIIYRGTTLGGETNLEEIGNLLFYNDTSASNDVTYYYRVKAKNSIGVGNLSEAVSAMPEAPAVPVNQPPTCEISSPLDGATLEGTIEISGTALDSDGTVQSVEIRINGNNWNEASGTTSWSYQLDTTTLSNGQHTITARSYDGENYSSETSISVTVDNPVSEDEEFEGTWLILLIVIIVVILLLILLFLKRRKKPEEEETKVEAPKRELPPPPPSMEEIEEEEEAKEEIEEEAPPEEELPPGEEIPPEEEMPPEEEIPPSEEEAIEEEPGEEISEEDTGEEIDEDELPPPDEEMEWELQDENEKFE